MLQSTNLAPARVWSVSELTSQIKDHLESEFTSVWLAGEISNLKRYSSGHIYFTLKDAGAQISAVIWRSAASLLVFNLSDGLEVIVHGRISLYEKQGKYQVVIDQVQPKGMGALELAFRQLRDKLDKEGLFGREHKKPLPRFPRRIVVVTSPDGAAVRDMFQVIGRRWRAVEIWLRPVRVQGDGAAQEIAAAIAEVNRLRNVDVMIVGRGGGSLEDLWAFNEEIVARAIFASRIPIVSAVGHEVDLTIADLVADRRALTPSEAGELVVPDEREIRHRLDQLAARIGRALTERWRGAKLRWEQLASRRTFYYPFDLIRGRQQRCDELAGRLDRAAQFRLSKANDRLARWAAALDGRSPLKILGRGYSLTTRADGRTVLKSAEEVVPGERIVTRLARGQIASRVEAVSSSDSEFDASGGVSQT
ncbi:MAG: exodeoxyribonuclease VII large subunit [Planctomycetes bacterium]|nr:exodeoxyribonuclease VII large subunit [Planctomycetota bacterium]